MRIGTPSFEWALVAANVAVAGCLGVVYLTQDTAGPPSAEADASPRRARPAVLVVVAAGSSADLVVGRSAAQSLGGALLAVPARGLTGPMTEELARTSPYRVLIIGGPAAVSEQTATELADHTPGQVTRLAGADRYATAARVARTQLTAPVSRIRLMSGDDVDLLRATLQREDDEAPLLLVEGTRIPAEVVAALVQLRPRTIEVAGSPSAVSDAVLRQLEQYTAGPVTRVDEST